MRAGVALGSNLGDRLANLRNARQEITALGSVRPPIHTSAIYETEPVGCEKGAAKFLNAAIEFEYAGEPADLRRELAGIEKRLGRPSSHERNASRSIDLDLLYFGQVELETEELRIPHPRISGREFVLRPLADIRPDLVLPKQTEPVNALLLLCFEPGAVVRFAAEW